MSRSTLADRKGCENTAFKLNTYGGVLVGNRILMSIKPEFAYAIVDGRKFYEYRRVVPREPFTTVVIYASSPVQRFIGEFDVDTIVTGSLEDVWSRTRHSGGIMRDYYDRYFAGKTEAHALHVLGAQKYRYQVDPKDIIPDFRPPQSFSYLTDEVYSRIVFSNGCLFAQAE